MKSVFSELVESDVVGQVLEGGRSQREGQSQRMTSLETKEDRRDMHESHGPLQRQSMVCLHAWCACWAMHHHSVGPATLNSHTPALLEVGLTRG